MYEISLEKMIIGSHIFPAMILDVFILIRTTTSIVAGLLLHGILQESRFFLLIFMVLLFTLCTVDELL